MAKIYGKRSQHQSIGRQIKCIRVSISALLVCSHKFIIVSDTCHLGMDWDNMAYDELVTQLKLIKAYIH